MIKNKNLLNIARKAVESSFTNSKLDEKNVVKFVSSVKKLPLAQAIFLLSNYIKYLKLEINKHLVIVESKFELTKNELTQITEKFNKDYKIIETKNILNPSILGGFKVKIGDNLFDYTVNSKINKLSEAIKN